jgi:hypothetical protein
MAKKKTIKDRTSYLKIIPLVEFGFAEYTCYVNTPEQETMYFNTKTEAQKFIKFYNEYQTKKTI